MATLKVLRIGSTGDDVKKWQYFLMGLNFYKDIVDGLFGNNTHLATINFQKEFRLEPDGIVGNKSYGQAMLLGFGAAVDDTNGKQTASWPPEPDFDCLKTDVEKQHLFGKFAFVHDPQPKNPEHIKITDNWGSKNLIPIIIPQLAGKAANTKIYFHKAAAAQMQALWKDWEDAALLHLVLTWAGAYDPRFVRGSRKTLSQHAFGTAFDINVAWNGLGAVPALVGQKGSVRELVELANRNGFYWGGHFSRMDGMHFEIARLH